MKVALGDVCRARSSLVDPAKAGHRSLPHIGPDSIEKGTGRLLGFRTAEEDGVTSGKYRFESGDILYSKIRPNLNKVMRASFAGLCSADMYPLAVDEDRTVAEYVIRVLRSQSFLDYATSLSNRANIPKLNRDQLMRFEFELPEIAEQRRIAAILDQADALRVKRRQVVKHFDVLRTSILIEMFGSPATWPSRWSMGVIGDMTESVQYGTSAKAGDTGEWPILRMGNVTDSGRLDLKDLKFINLGPRDVPKHTVRRGDMLFNRTNSKEKVGKTCVVDTDRPLALAGYLIRVRFKPVHSSQFVSAYLTSSHGLAVRQRMAKAAVNQANINATEMRSIPIAMPPSALQHEFARRVAAVESQRAIVLRALAADDELFASLQFRAFRAEL